MVCRFRKALYGLHQSEKKWYFEIHKILGKLGFKQFKLCNCAYTFEKHVVLLLCVDDIVIFEQDENWIVKVVNLLKRKFGLKVLGKTKKLLGVDFLEKDILYLHQLDYINKLYKSYEKFKFLFSL